jgi:hypothetical protein
MQNYQNKIQCNKMKMQTAMYSACKTANQTSKIIIREMKIIQ